MKVNICVASMCAVLLATGSALAHHTFAAYDLSTMITLTGTLTKVDWRNPHVELFLNVTNNEGQAETWTIETNAPRFFVNRSVTKSDFEDAIGKSLTIMTARARDGSLSGLLARITMPTGKTLMLAPSPANTR
jgi:Family of unknown function (DUF6152)